jgi:hypothetical protein
MSILEEGQLEKAHRVAKEELEKAKAEYRKWESTVATYQTRWDNPQTEPYADNFRSSYDAKSEDIKRLLRLSQKFAEGASMSADDSKFLQDQICTGGGSVNMRISQIKQQQVNVQKEARADTEKRLKGAIEALRQWETTRREREQVEQSAYQDLIQYRWETKEARFLSRGTFVFTIVGVVVGIVGVVVGVIAIVIQNAS